MGPRTTPWVQSVSSYPLNFEASAIARPLPFLDQRVPLKTLGAVVDGGRGPGPQRFPGLKFNNINKARGGSPKAAQTLSSPQNRSVPLETTVGSAAP